MVRSRIGPLALEAKLGDFPSQSLVYRGIHIAQKKAVAVKVFSVAFGGTPESRLQLTEEWGRLQKLQHPAIARCYGGGFDNNEAYLAYELINGDTLASQLERRSRLSWETVLDVGSTLCEGLVEAHRRGIVHGAIGPDKIVFAGLSAVLVDIRAERVQSMFRNPRQATPQELALLAPEFLANPEQFSHQCDLYSLAATMYLAITGRPPISGDTAAAVIQNAASEIPAKPASVSLDCPVWVSSFLEQALRKDPQNRFPDATAFGLALAEARRRSAGLTGVAEHASQGFSPLQVTRQTDKDEARKLLGRELVNLKKDKEPTAATSLWDNTWVLIAGLVIAVAGLTWLVWPLNESQMRGRAETLIAEGTSSSLHHAKTTFLQPMIKRFPDGESALWASDQIDQIEMMEAESALEVKLKRNLPLRDEGERLYAEARRFERFGDRATALDKYKSMETVLGNDPKYLPFVNLARRQVNGIRQQRDDAGEASRILQGRLQEADRLIASGNVIGARDIWYSVVELYSNNSDVAPLVKQAQDKLSGTGDSSR